MGHAMTSESFGNCLVPGLLLLAGLALAVYLLGLDPGGHDISYHLFRITDVSTLLAHGQWAADLSPMAANGQGLPVYVYYSQWVYWLPCLFVALGMPVFAALKAAYLCFITLALVGSYRLARVHVSPAVAAMATALLAGSVYFLGDIFTRSAYAEFAACAWLPLALLMLHHGLQGRERWGLAALPLAVMILFHPVSFLNTVPVLVAYALFVQPEVRRALGALLWVLGLALLLTAFFWLPALVETRYVRGISVFPENYADTFVPLLHQLGSFELPLNAGPLLAWMALLLAVRAGWQRLRRSAVASRRDWLLAGVLVYVFLMSRYSAWVWAVFTPLQANAFAWRLGMPLAILASLWVAVAFAGLVAERRQTAWAAVVLVLAMVQGALYLWVKGDRPVWRSTPTALVEQRIRNHAVQEWGWGVYEYLPLPAAVPVPPAADCVVDIQPSTVHRDRQDWQVKNPPAGCLLQLPVYWNVRYEARQGDVLLPVYATAQGRAAVLVSEGNIPVQLRWTRPAYVWAGDALSIVGGLCAAGLLCRRREA